MENSADESHVLKKWTISKFSIVKYQYVQKNILRTILIMFLSDSKARKVRKN